MLLQSPDAPPLTVKWVISELLEYQAIQFGNPRFYWTYADEDLVGLLMDIAQGCHVSTFCVLRAL